MITMALYYEGPGERYKTADLGTSATSAGASGAGTSTTSAPLLDNETLVSNVELPPDDDLAKDFTEQLQIEEDVGGRYILLPTKNPPKNHQRSWGQEQARFGRHCDPKIIH